MVATLVRLRLRALAHNLRREPWRVVVLVGGALWALLMMPSVVGGVLWLARQPADVVHDVTVVAGTLLAGGWLLVPVLVPSMDDTLEISRFATFGLRAQRLVPGMLAAGLVGVPALFTAVLCLAPVLLWSWAGQGQATVVAAAAAPFALLTSLLAARLATGAMTRVLGSRRTREVTAVGGLVLGVAVLLAALSLGAVGLEGALETVPTVAGVLAWTPFGAAWAAPAAAVGDPAQGWLHVLVAAAWTAGAWVLWGHQLARALTRPPERGAGGRRRGDGLVRPVRGPLGHLVDRQGPAAAAALAVARRSLRYWTADPRYLSAMLAAVLLPVVVGLLGATVIDAPAVVGLGIAALMAGTIGWGRHNDVAFDGTAFWMHVTARVPGRADRAGRAAATALWAVPVVVAVGLAGAAVAGRTDLAPVAVGAGLGVLAAGLAVSAVTSAALVYPVPAPGENPYAAQMGAVGASLVAQLVSSFATLVLSAPVLVLGAASLWWDADLRWATLAVGLLGGAGLLAAGVVVGGRVYDVRSVALLSRLGR